MKKLLTAVIAAFFATSGFCSDIISQTNGQNIIQNQVSQEKMQNLILQKASSKIGKFAGHFSHSSHASHASHASHFSSR